MNDSDSPAAVQKPALRWQCCRFDALTVYELERIHAARQWVFSIEQQCVYLDADGRDLRAHHLAAWSVGPEAADPQTLPLAYARLLEPGVAYDEPSIGRVITTAAARGTGLGRTLVQRAIALSRTLYPADGIRISAQSRLRAFYAAAGFVAVGTDYIEDGIPHIEMVLPP